MFIKIHNITFKVGNITQSEKFKNICKQRMQSFIMLQICPFKIFNNIPKKASLNSDIKFS